MRLVPDEEMTLLEPEEILRRLKRKLGSLPIDAEAGAKFVDELIEKAREAPPYVTERLRAVRSRARRGAFVSQGVECHLFLVPGEPIEVRGGAGASGDAVREVAKQVAAALEYRLED